MFSVTRLETVEFHRPVMLKLNFDVFIKFQQPLRTMSTALRSVKGPFNWVNNERVEPVDTSSGVINDIEPRSGKVLAQVPISGKKDVDIAVQAAKKAFRSWSKVCIYFFYVTLFFEYIIITHLARYF